MSNENIIEELGKISSKLNRFIGILTVSVMKDLVVAEAHKMALEIGRDIDNLIYEIEEEMANE